MLLALGVTLALVDACWQVIPPFVNDFILQDELQNEVRFATPNHKDEEGIREDVKRKLKQLGIAVRPEDIHVDWFEDGVRVRVDYSVPVHFPWYKTQLAFHTQGDSRSL